MGISWGGILGAVLGGASYLSSVRTQEQALKRKIDDLKAEEADTLKVLDENFNVAKDEATKTANKSDEQQTQNEIFAASDVNYQLGVLQANEEGQGASNNAAAMQIGSSKGDSLSQIAASGTRNSSQAQAVEMQDAVNTAQLEASEKQARANDDYSLYQVLNSLATNTATIQSNRTEALDLRKSYDDGSVYGTAGNQYKLYQTNREKTVNSYTRAINEADQEREEILNKGNVLLGLATSMFNGATGGIQLSNSLKTAISNANSTGDNAKSVAYGTSLNTKSITIGSSAKWNALT